MQEVTKIQNLHTFLSEYGLFATGIITLIVFLIRDIISSIVESIKNKIKKSKEAKNNKILFKKMVIKTLDDLNNKIVFFQKSNQLFDIENLKPNYTEYKCSTYSEHIHNFNISQIMNSLSSLKLDNEFQDFLEILEELKFEKETNIIEINESSTRLIELNSLLRKQISMCELEFYKFINTQFIKENFSKETLSHIEEIKNKGSYETSNGIIHISFKNVYDNNKKMIGIINNSEVSTNLNCMSFMIILMEYCDIFDQNKDLINSIKNYNNNLIENSNKKIKKLESIKYFLNN
ncbi:hypothetical protein [Aureivirga sp. CE67]|uniref:hypothetical protein n=1 Tax=Aureivirga sp. CE67 TaxID=1788983 RepID=UPI0018CA0DD2|nr:hypothetical protein [Aureivirga sp. CE67]